MIMNFLKRSMSAPPNDCHRFCSKRFTSKYSEACIRLHDCVCVFMGPRVLLLLQRPRRVFTLMSYSASAAGRFQPHTPAQVNMVTVKGVVPAVKIDGRYG